MHNEWWFLKRVLYTRISLWPFTPRVLCFHQEPNPLWILSTRRGGGGCGARGGATFIRAASSHRLPTQVWRRASSVVYMRLKCAGSRATLHSFQRRASRECERMTLGIVHSHEVHLKLTALSDDYFPTTCVFTPLTGHLPLANLDVFCIVNKRS